MHPSGIRGNARGPGQNIRERLQARLEANRRQAKMDGIERLINADPGYRARFAAVENQEQRHRLLKEFCDSHLEEIGRLVESIDSGRAPSPVKTIASNAPAESSTPRSRVAAEPSSPGRPVEKSSPRNSVGSPSPLIPEEPPAPHTPAESPSPRMPTEASSSSRFASGKTFEGPSSPGASSPGVSSPGASSPGASSSKASSGPSSPGSSRYRRQSSEGRQRRAKDAPLPAERPSAAMARSKSFGPDPAGWSLNEARPRFQRQLSESAGRKAELFQKYIRQGYAPADAASMLGPGSMLKLLNPSTGQYEIRLNQHDRLTFLSDDVMKRITILQIGGHT